MLFFLNNSSEKVLKRFIVHKLALNIEKTQAIASLKIQCEEVLLVDSIIGRSIRVKYLGILFDRHLNFTFHFAEVVEELPKHYSVRSQRESMLKI